MLLDNLTCLHIPNNDTGDALSFITQKRQINAGQQSQPAGVTFLNDAVSESALDDDGLSRGDGPGM